MDEFAGGYEMMNFGGGGIIMMLIFAVLLVLPFWKLWGRTGHSPWISLLMLIPMVNVIVLYVLAFKAWPIDENQG